MISVGLAGVFVFVLSAVVVVWAIGWSVIALWGLAVCLWVGWAVPRFVLWKMQGSEGRGFPVGLMSVRVSVVGRVGAGVTAAGVGVACVCVVLTVEDRAVAEGRAVACVFVVIT